MSSTPFTKKNLAFQGVVQTKLASFKLGKESADRVILKEYADMPNDARVQVLDVPAAVRDAVDAKNILSQLGPCQCNEPNKDENTEQAPESPKAKSLFDFNMFSYKA